MGCAAERLCKVRLRFTVLHRLSAADFRDLSSRSVGVFRTFRRVSSADSHELSAGISTCALPLSTVCAFPTAPPSVPVGIFAVRILHLISVFRGTQLMNGKHEQLFDALFLI